jgi:hypothetical protein
MRIRSLPTVKVYGAQNRHSQIIYENNTCHDRPK